MLAEPQPLPQPLPSSNQQGYSLKHLFFSPIRFCGRQWMWITGNDQQMVLKGVALPFLLSATLVSGIIAAVGVRIFSVESSGLYVDFIHAREHDLLRRDISDQDTARRIRDHLRQADCECSVEVLSSEREVIHDYFPNHIHRFVTLKNSSRVSRIWAAVKQQFWNQNPPHLNHLYPCVFGEGTDESIARLKDVLALHRSVTFSMAFDLAYVRAEIA